MRIGLSITACVLVLAGCPGPKEEPNSMAAQVPLDVVVPYPSVGLRMPGCAVRDAEIALEANARGELSLAGGPNGARAFNDTKWADAVGTGVHPMGANAVVGWTGAGYLAATSAGLAMYGSSFETSREVKLDGLGRVCNPLVVELERGVMLTYRAGTTSCGETAMPIRVAVFDRDGAVVVPPTALSAVMGGDSADAGVVARKEIDTSWLSRLDTARVFTARADGRWVVFSVTPASGPSFYAIVDARARPLALGAGGGSVVCVQPGCVRIANGVSDVESSSLQAQPLGSNVAYELGAHAVMGARVMTNGEWLYFEHAAGAEPRGTFDVYDFALHAVRPLYSAASTDERAWDLAQAFGYSEVRRVHGVRAAPKGFTVLVRTGSSTEMHTRLLSLDCTR